MKSQKNNNMPLTNLQLQELRCSYPQGMTLFREGEDRNCAYIIEKGEVEISVIKDGKKVPLVRLGEGEVFGEAALIGSGKRSATATATEDCEVFRIFPSILRDRIMRLDPLVGLLMSLLVNRYRKWRYVSPELAAEAGVVEHAREDLSQVDKADGFLSDLNAQKKVALQELRMAQNIVEAVAKGELGPYLQPIVTLPDRKLAGFEALIRWHHPEKGMISPVEFIPVAERTNIVGQLDMMMLERVCEIVPDIQKAAGVIGRKIYVSVNLSGIHFDSDGFADEVVEIVRRSKVDPAQIVLEITESALMGSPERAEATLRKFKAHGLTISLDDFGTGYSSLSYLHKFSIDILKVDQSFVSDIHNKNSKSFDVVRAIVSLARTFNLSTVAEGIEHEEDISALTSLGCGNGQGYFFSKPMPVDQALEFVRTSVAKYG
ncbi:MAG: EAL domain-containing protein [Alphaproteobacteria bacterium]|nr:EAL domain-containing protein [Alphaproteobacteria bacterium]MDE2336558.1 EAL domain-containing protein [Alphaproteobacteria bacterium]